MKKCILIITTVLLLSALLCGCSGDPYDSLRLHVIANSDSSADQSVKLKVRDAVLAYMGAQDFASREEAYGYAAENLSGIESAANSALIKNGFAYTARCSLGQSDFPDRDYGGELYPAGEYTALKVILGKGEGANWWCVIFPPLCLVTPAEYEKIGSEGITYKSYIAQAIKNIFGGGKQ